MSEPTPEPNPAPIPRPDNQSASEPTRDSILQRDLELFDMKLAETKPSPGSREENPKLWEELTGIGHLGGSFEGRNIAETIVITYNTRTGEIVPVPQTFRFGDYSKLQLDLVLSPKSDDEPVSPNRASLRDGHKYLRLYYPGNWPTPFQYQTAMAEEPIGHQEETRKVLPERIVLPSGGETTYQVTNRLGLPEQWGYSKLLEGDALTHISQYDGRDITVAPGDNVILEAIHKFNDKYGPPR